MAPPSTAVTVAPGPAAAVPPAPVAVPLATATPTAPSAPPATAVLPTKPNPLTQQVSTTAADQSLSGFLTSARLGQYEEALQQLGAETTDDLRDL
jgi:hypothetical protein